MEADDTSGVDAERSRDLVDELTCASAELALRGELLDALADSIFLHDLDGNIVYANEVAWTTRGYTREEFMAINIHQLDAPGYAELIKTRIEEVRAQGDGRFESVTTRKDNSTFPVEISARIIDGQDGKLILSVVRDMTHSKTNETELKRSKHMLEDVTQGIREGIFLLTCDFKILWANKAAIENSGYAHDEVIGNFCYKVSHGLDRPCAPPSDPCPIDQLRKTGEPIMLIHRHVDKEKNATYVEVSAYPTRYEDGSPVEFAHVARDVTERIQAEEELMRLNKDLEAFSYSVSHDLRAPLRAIAGFTRIIFDEHSEQFDENARRLSGIVMRNIVHMDELIEALLAFSKLGRQRLAISEIDMNRLARDAFEEVMAAAAGADVELVLDDLPPAMGDPVLMRQVLTNLLSNAVKFSSKEKHAVVRVGGHSSGDENAYWVKDNGVGFNTEYADRLFKVFSRLHSDEEFEGTGIGLANVQRIIERHGGTVGAQSAPGEGATFSFTVPKTIKVPDRVDP